MNAHSIYAVVDVLEMNTISFEFNILSNRDCKFATRPREQDHEQSYKPCIAYFLLCTDLMIANQDPNACQ